MPTPKFCLLISGALAYLESGVLSEEDLRDAFFLFPGLDVRNVDHYHEVDEAARAKLRRAILLAEPANRIRWAKPWMSSGRLFIAINLMLAVHGYNSIGDPPSNWRHDSYDLADRIRLANAGRFDMVLHPEKPS